MNVSRLERYRAEIWCDVRSLRPPSTAAAATSPSGITRRPRSAAPGIPRIPASAASGIPRIPRSAPGITRMMPVPMSMCPSSHLSRGINVPRPHRRRGVRLLLIRVGVGGV